MERGCIVWIAVKLMRPWKDLETGRVCLVITVKTCVTNYHVQPANEHWLPDHAPYSITGERDEERASRREEREEPGSFSPSMTFRLMRPRRASYFLNLTGRCPHALRDVFFLFQPTSKMQVGKLGESKQDKVNMSACVKQEEQLNWMKMCSLLNLEFPLHICFIYVLFCCTQIKRY